MSYKEGSLSFEMICKFEVLRTITLNLELWLNWWKDGRAQMGLHFSMFLENFSNGEETQGFSTLEAGAPSCPFRHDGGQEDCKQGRPGWIWKPSTSSPPSPECCKYCRLFASPFLEIVLELVNFIYLITIFLNFLLTRNVYGLFCALYLLWKYENILCWIFMKAIRSLFPGLHR